VKRNSAPGRYRRRFGQPGRREELSDARLNVGIAVSRQDGDSRAFPRRIRHHVIPLKQQPEVDDAEEHEQHQRQHDRELDELGSRFRGPVARPTSQRSHIVTTVPARIDVA
jgi:hypothetical protein